MSQPFGDDDIPDRLVFIPGEDLDERPKRVSDRPIRPAPRPIDDGTPQRWSPEVKEKKTLIPEELRVLVGRLIMLAVVAGSLFGLYHLINWVLEFYGIALF